MSSHPEPSNEQLASSEPDSGQMASPPPTKSSRIGWIVGWIIVGALALLTITFFCLSAYTTHVAIPITGTVLSVGDIHGCGGSKYDGFICGTYQVSYTIDGQTYTKTFRDATTYQNSDPPQRGDQVPLLVSPSNHASVLWADESSPWTAAGIFSAGFTVLGVVVVTWTIGRPRRASKHKQDP